MAVEEAVLKSLLSTLNEQQKKAVQHDYTQALQVIAGPGTGKTKVLTSRVAYLLLKHKLRPQDVIVTTFTNKAAKEMFDRLVLLLKDTDIKVSQLMIGTFHSIAIKILHRYGESIGLPTDWRIADEKETDTIINDLVKNVPDQIRDDANSLKRKVNLCLPKNGTDDWVIHQKMVKKNIGKLKSNAILPEEYITNANYDPALGYFYEQYFLELKKINALDFDDLLMYTFRLLVKSRCMPSIQHVFVDEFQDTNGIQIDLMFLLARGNHHLSRGVTIVGDPDQSIYAFRNALSQNFQTMIQKSPIPTSQIILVENYRSSQKILDTSETLISQQQSGRAHRLPLKAQFDIDFPPVYIPFPTSFLQSPSLVRELLYLKSLPGLFTYDDFAFLVRQRRQFKSIETALITHRIPYKIIRGHAFWERKETTALINLLKSVYSNNERNAIISTLQYPVKGFGQTSAERVKAVIESSQLEAYEVLQKLASNTLHVDIPEKARSVLKNFVNMIDKCKLNLSSNKLSDLETIFETLYEQSGLKLEFSNEDGKKRSENMMEKLEMDPRHQNVMLLKGYLMETDTKEFTDIKKNEKKSTPRNAIFLEGDIKDHLRDFFNSLSLYTNDVNSNDNPSYDKINESGQEKSGFVTISTIHGAKGLEWPVVFIPGCDEGIIPSVFRDEESNQDVDSDVETDQQQNKEDANQAKKKGPSDSDTINEERRMFFVAQTRAKFLLYLSSVSSQEGQYTSTPSRFLTPQLLKTMVDDQNVFANQQNIFNLYQASRKVYPKNKDVFKLKNLLDDYKKFIEGKRQFFVWNGQNIRDVVKLDLNCNVLKISSNPFSTAADQLQLEQQSKLRAPELKTKSNYSLSRTHSDTSNYSKSGSVTSTVKRQFAPGYSPVRCAPNSIRNKPKQFAPATNHSSSTNISPTAKRLGTSPVKKILNSPSTFSSNAAPVAKLEFDKHRDTIVNSEDNIPEFEKKFRQNQNRIKPMSRVTRKITTKPISFDEDSYSSSLAKCETIDLETTAAELLHDPREMLVDNRPIVTSAKTLADAIKVETKKNSVKSKVKVEQSLSQFDIFSQLTKAKKKAKSNDGEIIVID